MQARRSDCGAAQRLALRAELPESEDGESSGSICCMSSSPSTPKHYPNKSHRLAISAHQAHPSTYEQRWHARLGQKAWYKVQVDMGEAIARARRLSQQSQAGVQRHPPAHTPCSPLSTAPRAAGSSCPKMRIALFAASVCVTSQDVTDRDGYNKEQGQARYLANVFEKDLKRIESRRVASRASPTHHLKCTLVLALLVVDLRELVQVCGQSTHIITVMQPTYLSCIIAPVSCPRACHASASAVSSRQRRGRLWPVRRQGDAPESFAPGRQMIFSPKKDAVGSIFLSSAARTCLRGKCDRHAIPNPRTYTSHVHTCRRHRAALLSRAQACARIH